MVLYGSFSLPERQGGDYRSTIDGVFVLSWFALVFCPEDDVKSVIKDVVSLLHDFFSLSTS